MDVGSTEDRTREFPETHWSVVLAARGAITDQCRGAMDRLVRSYWGPVYWMIRRGWHKSREDAKDLTQEFFARLLDQGAAEGFDAERGRFRPFLCAAVRHFLLQEERDGARQKRGGGRLPFSLDAIELDGAAPADASVPPEAVYQQEWIATLVREAVSGLAEEYALAGRGQRYRVFELYDLTEGERPTHVALAAELGIGVHDVNNHLREVRQRLREKIRAIVRETLANPSELDDEMHVLFG